MVFAEGSCKNWKMHLLIFIKKRSAGRPSWQEVAASDVSKVYWFY